MNREEEKQFRKLVQTNPIYKEVKMLQSVEEVGIEKGIEKGRNQALEETAKNLLKADWLAKQQIAEATGLDIHRIDELAEFLKSQEVVRDTRSEKQIH
ncbi:hypothetical protein QUF80_22505 [Desulfococcaceae bacterium HSG8]|nr:hypothetical protein [Desulfococcaceae bacterium HSG8]